MTTQNAAEAESGYTGIVRVKATNGELLDAVPARLGPSGVEVPPWRGELYPKVGSAISNWSGPVVLELRDGTVLSAVIRPGTVEGQLRRVIVTGRGASPFGPGTAAAA